MRMMHMLSFFLFITPLYAYIAPCQWQIIHDVIQNKPPKEDTTQHELYLQKKEQMNHVIYTHYESWAFRKAYHMKKLHYYKCSHISQEEMNLYASIGLYEAIKRYQPSTYSSSQFTAYACKYVTGFLFMGMTDMQPISLLSKTERKKSLEKRKDQTHSYSKPIHASYMFDKYNDITNANDKTSQLQFNDNAYKEVWQKINTMDVTNLSKKIIIKKYSFEFDKINSNKKIGDMFGCSEEYIRKQLLLFLKEYEKASLLE